MFSRKCFLGVLMLCYIAADYSAVATYTFPTNPPNRNNLPQPQPTTANPWVTFCPNLNNLAGKGKVSIKELNTVFIPALADYTKTAAKAATEMAALKLPRNISNEADMKAFWTKFNASDAKFAEGRKKALCYTMEELTRINSNGGQVDGASTTSSGAARLNITFTYNCSQIRMTALKYLRVVNITTSLVAEAADAMQRAYEDDSKCYQKQLLDGIGGPIERFKFDNMNAATVKKTLEEMKLVVEPVYFLNPVGVTLKLALAATNAMADLMRRP